MSNQRKTDLTALAIFFPSVLALAIIPVLMRATLVSTELIDTYRYFGGTQYEDGKYYLIDIFSQCKAFAVVVFAIIMMVIALLCCMFLFKRAEKRSLVYVGMSVVYVALTLVSALCSEYTDIAFYGQFDRAEGFFTTACYFVIFLFTMYAFRDTQNFKYVIFALFFCVGVNTVIGIFQFTGNNLINFEWFSSLIMDSKYADMLEINKDLSSKSLYGALYNYNYVGSFTGMVIPLFTTMAIFDRKILHKVLFIIFDMMALFMLMGSTVRSGVVAVVAAFAVGIIFFARIIIKHWKISLPVVAAAVVLVLAGNLITSGAFLRRVSTLLSDMVQVVAPAEEKTDIFDSLPVREIVHNDDGSVSFVAQTDTLNVSFDYLSDSYIFTDSGGNPIELSVSDSGTITADDKRFEGISFEVQGLDEWTYADGSMLYMWFGNDSDSVLAFYLYGGKNIHMIDKRVGDRITPVNAEHIGFEGKELVGTSRGYIWSRTLPLLKNCMVIGYGADTFAYIFPQNDFLAKYYSYEEGFDITIDKPHNLYLQIFISNGLIALIAFLAICAFYLVDCVRLYALRREYRAEQIYGAAVMLAVVGYLTAGMFNDSVVSVAPVFWILLGVGCALNTINRRMDKNLSVTNGNSSEPKPVKLTEQEMQKEQEMDEQVHQILNRMRGSDRSARERRTVTREDVNALLEKTKKLAENTKNDSTDKGKDS